MKPTQLTHNTVARHLLTVFCLLLAWLCSLQAHAADRVALVIGNQNYRHDALDTPINDATKVADKLRKLGFSVVSVGHNLDRREMLEKVRAFRQNINRDTEIALFFYAGHGAQYDNESYLIPLQANLQYANDLPIEAVKAKDILNQIEEQNAKVNVMILDACRNLPLKRANRSSMRGLAPMESHSSTLIAYSTKAGETAKDKGNSGVNSPYTEVLLKYLQDRAEIPLTQFFNDISYEVFETYGQEPWMSSSRIPRVYLKKPTVQAVKPPRQNAQTTQTADTAPTQSPASTQPTNRPSQGQKIDHYMAYDDGTVKDSQTGLVWQRCTYGQTWNASGCSGEPKKVNWDAAMKLNKNGWRVPTVKELGTIVYCSSGETKGVSKSGSSSECAGNYHRPTINIIAFPDTKTNQGYWSSSPDRHFSNNAWVVFFSTGNDNNYDKSHSRYVRLVRGASGL